LEAVEGLSTVVGVLVGVCVFWERHHHFGLVGVLAGCPVDWLDLVPGNYCKLKIVSSLKQ